MLRTNARRGLITRASLILLVCGLFGFALTFVPAPSAHAATLTPNCGVYREAWTYVYDSYNHNEGILSVHYNDCNRDIWGTFLSNTNTWKTVTVYIEYSYMPGYLDFTYGWAPNTNFNSPYYIAGFSTCYYAEVDLVDNRGVNNWYNTGNVCE